MAAVAFQNLTKWDKDIIRKSLSDISGMEDLLDPENGKISIVTQDETDYLLLVRAAVDLRLLLQYKKYGNQDLILSDILKPH